MKPLSLRLKSPPAPGQRLNLCGLTPCRLADLSIPEIAAIEIKDGTESTTLADWFEMTDGSREELVIEGNCSDCDHIGGGLTAGRMTILGSVGDFLARDMQGGSLTVVGDCGSFAGNGLCGGIVSIQGNAGTCLGGAIPGRRLGMRGGTMIVHGNAGAWAASRMRRGTLIIHGRVGNGLAMRMVAGSVVCCGQVSPLLGCGMKRGSLFFMRSQEDLGDIPGFSDFEQQELSFLPMFLKSLRGNLPEDLNDLVSGKAAMLPRRAARSMGDRCCGGLGEVICCNW